MAKEPSKILSNFMDGLEEFDKEHKDQVESFYTFMGVAYRPGAIDTKTKELMSIAISLNLHCEEMIVFHTYKAMQAGASPAEVYETAILAATFGGNGVVSHIATLLRESVRDFEKDFKK